MKRAGDGQSVSTAAQPGEVSNGHILGDTFPISRRSAMGKTTEGRKSAAARRMGTLAALVTVAALLGMYVLAYVSLGSYDEFPELRTGRVSRVTRLYREKWIADVFYPLGVIEGWCYGIKVYVGYT